MKIKLIIFDLGGVLTLPDEKESPFIKISKRYGIQEKEFDKFFYKYFEDYHFKRTLSQFNFWKKTLKEINKEVSEEEIHEIINLFNNEVLGRFNPDMINLLKKLSRDYKLALLSNSSREMDKIIFSSEWIRYFDRIALSHINSNKKPNKEAFLQIIEAFGFSPEEVLFIDDKEKNILGAKKLGIKTILFKDYKHLSSRLKNLEIIESSSWG